MEPNIVLVSIDSLRADYTSFVSDGQDGTTPFLQSLVSESRVFENCISPSVWTLPVHASLFTGLFPIEHDVFTENDALGDHPTLAEQLSNIGYDTGAFYGNSWFDTADLLRGFNHHHNSSKGTDASLSSVGDYIARISPRIQWLLARLYHGQKLYREWQNNNDQEYSNTNGQETIDTASSKLKTVESSFFWFVHLNDAHWKYQPPAPYHREFTDRSLLNLVYNTEYWQDKVYGSRTNRLKTIIGEIKPPEREVTTFKNLYKGSIKYCDFLVEQLVDYLKDIGEWNKTILIVFGDHGDCFGEDGVFGHTFTLDDSLIRVPLLIRDPFDNIEPGTTTDPVSLIDIYPTILNIAGSSPPETSAIDLTSDNRLETFSFFDMSNHRIFTEGLKENIGQDELPPEIQYIIWKSKEEKEIYFPNYERWRDIEKPNPELRTKLLKFIDETEVINSKDRQLDANVQERLEQMGYLRD